MLLLPPQPSPWGWRCHLQRGLAGMAGARRAHTGSGVQAEATPNPEPAPTSARRGCSVQQGHGQANKPALGRGGLLPTSSAWPGSHLQEKAAALSTRLCRSFAAGGKPRAQRCPWKGTGRAVR